MDCLIEVATRGDRDSMIKVARAFDTGVNLGRARYDLITTCFHGGMERGNWHESEYLQCPWVSLVLSEGHKN